MKTCTKCGVLKELNQFYYRKDTNTHRTECKECTKRAKAIRESLPGVKELRAKKEKERRLLHKDTINNVLKLQRSTYLRDNVRATNTNCRHNRRSSKSDGIKTSELIQWHTEQVPLCVYCNSSVNLTVDHIVPLSKGGTHTTDNLCLACALCNSSKYTHSILYFMACKNQLK